MFYHVIIERKNSKGKQLSELDKLHEREIIDEVILPYVNKQDFQFNGYFLSPSEIGRIVVRKSELSSEILAKNANDRMPSNVILYISPLRAVQNDTYTEDITKELFNKGKEVNEAQKIIKNRNDEQPNAPHNTNRIFIVHGQDELAKTQCESFLQQIGYEPIILHKEVSQGRTIIEKIEYFSDVGFGIVLYTPCDKGGKAEDNIKLQSRARQNVVLEHGFLMGKIGRSNVVALVKGKIELPNDISGIVYQEMDDGDAWKFKVAREMKAAGYDVDANKIK